MKVCKLSFIGRNVFPKRIFILVFEKSENYYISAVKFMLSYCAQNKSRFSIFNVKFWQAMLNLSLLGGITFILSYFFYLVRKPRNKILQFPFFKQSKKERRSLSQDWSQSRLRCSFLAAIACGVTKAEPPQNSFVVCLEGFWWWIWTEWVPIWNKQCFRQDSCLEL